MEGAAVKTRSARFGSGSFSNSDSKPSFKIGSEPVPGTEDPEYTFRFADLGILMGLELRLPYSVERTDQGISISFLEVHAGFGVHKTYFNFKGTSESGTSFSPGLTVGVRWGATSPITAAFFGKSQSAGLSFMYRRYFNNDPVESAFIFGLEVF